MTRKRHQTFFPPLLVCLMLTLTLLGTGCAAARYWHYITNGPKEKKVKAQFRGLVGKKVAVMVYIPDEVLYDYPDARYSLATRISTELESKIKNVTVVDARTVSRYQDDNIRWDEKGFKAICDDLHTDFILFVPIQEYRMNQPGHFSAIQGFIVGHLELHAAGLDEQYDTGVWETDEELELTHPEHQPIYQRQAGPRIRLESERLFAKEVVKNFHDHVIIVDPEERQ
jgi:hypothetical protein